MNIFSFIWDPLFDEQTPEWTYPTFFYTIEVVPTTTLIVARPDTAGTKNKMSEGKGEEKAEGDPFCVAEENAGAGGESLVEMVQNYFYTDESFQTVFEKFCDDHWDVIDTSSDEHRLEYSQDTLAFLPWWVRRLESVSILAFCCCRLARVARRPSSSVCTPST